VWSGADPVCRLVTLEIAKLIPPRLLLALSKPYSKISRDARENQDERKSLAMFVIQKLLNSDQLVEIRTELKDAQWQEGALTTSEDFKNVKSNKQVLTGNAVDKIKEVLLGSPLFLNAILFKGFCKLMIVKYEEDMHYGTHSDSWIQNGRRADFSFTVFLNDKDDYKGGELIIEDKGKESTIKLDAGSIVMYPSTVLHRVNKVTKGTRLVSIGWVTSYVKNEEYRNILYDLAQVRAEVYQKTGSSKQHMKLTQIYNNLMRLWSE